MTYLKHTALSILTVLTLNACAPAQQHASMQTAPIISDTSNFDSRVYTLGVGDYLRVTVFGQEQLSGEYLIDSNGNLPLPLVQSIPARGLTVNELQQQIISTLSPKYLRNPRVSVEIIEYRDIYVLGEVRNPGKYPYVPNMSIVQAVAVAGGHTYRGKEDAAEVTRDVDGQIQTFNAPANSFVEPGDTIIVKRRWF